MNQFTNINTYSLATSGWLCEEKKNDRSGRRSCTKPGSLLTGLEHRNPLQTSCLEIGMPARSRRGRICRLLRKAQPFLASLTFTVTLPAHGDHLCHSGAAQDESYESEQLVVVSIMQLNPGMPKTDEVAAYHLTSTACSSSSLVVVCQLNLTMLG